MLACLSFAQGLRHGVSPVLPVASYVGCYPSGIYFFDGGLVCGDNFAATYDYVQTFVDSGTNPNGGLYHLMKSDATLWDAGLVIEVPLGFFPEYLQDPGTPDYVCQPQAYSSDGGWLLSDIGPTHVDLTECGGTPANLPSGYFPCCGGMHDPGTGQQDLCKPDGRGVKHCACISDGNPCDVPRTMDSSHFEGPGECCSPGSSVQAWDAGAVILDGGTMPALYAGEGWCRSAAGIDPYDGGPYAARAPGFCNVLPDGQACNVDSDCLTNAGSMAGHGACNTATHTCGCDDGNGRSCGSTHDCCGGYICFDAGGPPNNFCT